jgi:hypothetical protein
MPAISRIRFTNVIYENGAKRYNDMTFRFDGQNAAILLENGGGKTVLIQTAMQAIIPHIDLAERKIKDTLSLENGPAHIAIEWILNDQPRRYVVTATTLFLENNMLNSIKYVYEYGAEDPNSIEKIPFSMKNDNHTKRPASKGEISEYYYRMKKNDFNAKVFDTIKDFGDYIENNFKIIPAEWRRIGVINSGEGNVDEFFSKCKTTDQLLNRLLIPIVEEAMESGDSGQFVETFEKQREHFKKNKELQEKIEQSQLVMGKIDEYVETYKGYHDISKNYDNVKCETNKTARDVSKHLKLLNTKLINNQDKFGSANRDLVELERKQLSLKIHEINHEIEQLSDEKSILTKTYNTSNSELIINQTRKQNIEWTKLENKIQQSLAQIERIKEKIDEIDKNLGINDLKDKLEQNNHSFKDYFTYRLSCINTKVNEINNEGGIVKEKSLNNKQEIILASKEKDEALKEHSSIDTSVKHSREVIKDLEKELFKDSSEYDVDSFYKEISQERQQLANQISEIQLDIEATKNQIEQYKGEQLINDNALISNKHDYEYKKKELEELNRVQNDLISEIEGIGHHVYGLNGIYDKEESIINGIDERYKKAVKEKDKALLQERNSKRIYDLYYEEEHFCADPILNKVINGLENSVGFISLGTDYLDTITKEKDITKEEVFSNYPMWAITLVTTDSDIEKVCNAVRHYEDLLMYPAIVITLEQANRFIKDGTEIQQEGVSIYPKYWSSNLNSSSFERFKETAKDNAKTAEKSRVDAEDKVNNIYFVLQKIRNFLKEHPFIKYNYLLDEVRDLSKEIEQRNERQVLLNEEISRSNSHLEIINNKFNISKESLSLLGDKLKLAERLINEHKSLNDKQKSLADKERKLENVRSDYERLININEEYEEKLRNLEKSINELNLDKTKVYENSIYKELIDSGFINTLDNSLDISENNINYEVLKNTRIDLQNELSGISKDRVTLESELKREIDILDDNRKEKEHSKNSAKYNLEVLDFYYEDEIDSLIVNIRDLESRCKDLNAMINEKDKLISNKEGIRSTYENELKTKYSEIYLFDKPLDEVRISLDKEKNNINKAIKELKHEKARLDSSIGLMNNIDISLRSNDGKHGFSLMSVEEDIINSVNEDIIESVVSELIINLDKAKRELTSKKEYVDNEKDKVIDYCKLNLHDYRIKEAAVSGIQSKKSYKELLEYQQGMHERIEKTIRLLEDDRRESDKELQTFLTHLHTYVKNVAIELDMIQRRTTIKIDDAIKQIFLFDIPVWDEEEGKEALRRYIDQIVAFFDREKERFDNDEIIMRKEIEEKLCVQNLLQVVMGDQTVKIKCRKVSNDMKISNTPTSWESSNRWSGGEKWSKNMTLFLSILNYLAGKKQHLNQSQKNNRVVILDNPFGKASSNHVLAPVFKIADKLGFQIIALTAHAEGKFISDYFPVVYSCRLRHTKDGERQVMTSDKQINVAYLREHSPKSIIALQEVEQLSLI